MPPDCANCSTPLAGRFCSSCGQDSNAPPLSARRFLLTQTVDLLGFDSRVGHTVAALLLRPGALTRAFLAGQRIRYLAPLSLYLLLASLFFFLHTVRPFVSFDPGANALRSNLSAVSGFGSLTAEQLTRLAAAGISVAVFAERFGAVATALLPPFFLGSLLLFSAGLWTLNRRTPLGSQVHPVFALHWGAFYLALGSLDRLLALVGIHSIQLAMVYSALSLAYLVVAVRRVFGRAWALAILQGLALLLWFYILFAAWLGSVMALATRLTIP